MSLISMSILLSPLYTSSKNTQSSKAYTGKNETIETVMEKKAKQYNLEINSA